MNFAECPICHLVIPRTMLIPVIVHNKGKQFKVLICERCKEMKEKESTKG